MKDYSVLLTCGETAMVIMHDAFDKGYEQGYKDGKSEKNEKNKDISAESEEMKIIVTMPEKVYNWIKREWVVDETDSVFNQVMNSVMRGTPLPKGYGRLIDADALKKDDEVTEWLSLNAVRTGKMLKRFSELFIEKIDAAETILEADNDGNAEYEAKAITRGRCMICGKELDEGLFFCKECEAKAESEEEK